MQIQIYSGIYCDALRIVAACRNVYNKFYQRNRFIVVPHLVEGHGLAVHLPQIDFTQITDFWDRIKSVEEKGLSIDDSECIDLVKDVEEYLIQNNCQPTVTEATANLVRDKIEKLLPQFQNTLSNLLTGQHFDMNTNIRIYLSLYHTGVNFRLDKQADNSQITLLYRPDTPISSLFEGILSLLVKDRNNSNDWQGPCWRENESVVDFLMRHTKLSELFPEIAESTLGDLSALQNNSELALESRNYFAKLGFPIESSISVDHKDELLINNSLPTTQFTTTETKLLKYLAENKQKVVRFDELGNLIWEDNVEKYSLWAISKYIQRIREKLVANGLNQEILKTKRGFGYFLFD